MDRIIVDDNVSAFYALQLKQRLEELEQSGMGKDEEGNIVTVTADQIINEGTEIGGITIGGTRTAFYAPNVETPEAITVEVTPIQMSGTRIATVKVGNETKTLYAPQIQQDGSGSAIDLSGKLDAPATQGTAGQVLATDGSGNNYWTTIEAGEGGSTIITGGGEGAYPLLNSFTLTEDVSSIIISEDSNGNTLSLTEGFYIEAELEQASSDRAKFFNVYIGSSSSEANVLISANHALNTDRFTYADVLAKQIAPNRWLVQARAKSTMYEAANGAGTAVGQLGYSNWNGMNNPPAVVNRIVLSYNTNKYGKDSKIKIYGR